MADLLKYFRIEARELYEQLQRGVLELERGSASGENLARLLRLAHTLKGAARVVKQPRIAELSHRLEDLLVTLREQPQAAVPATIEALLEVVDAIGGELSALLSAPGEPAAPRPDRASERAPGVSPSGDARSGAAVTTGELDALLDSVSELGFQLANARRALPSVEQGRSLLQQLGARLERQRGHEWNAASAVALCSLAQEVEQGLAHLEGTLSLGLERAAHELSQVRGHVERLRLVSAASMFGALERTLRDAAVGLDKDAIFEAEGGEVRLDAEVLTAVQRALVQAVRNAVAHGIESRTERQASGKPTRGRVRLEVLRRGKHVCFVCQDDGRGVDVAEVRRQGERLGRLDAARGEPSGEQLVELLLEGGISTSAAVSEVAGRGIGLNLIREALVGVGGGVALTTQPGFGTRLELSVPASLSALEALLVETNGQRYALPLTAVAQARRLAAGELHHGADGVSMSHDGKLVRFRPLAALLRRPAPARVRDAAWSVLLLQARGGTLALGVDRLLGSENITWRPLPDAVEADPTIAGVALDADGDPRLVLDAEGLVAAAELVSLPSARPTPKPHAVLVVDDSLTTRMLEQSILESAGYEVELATSAEEGLEKAQQRQFDLFLVDVEMPDMDGFEFIQRVRGQPTTADTPAVLVTSRASSDDVARGKAAGANAHVAKHEFDQGDFLRTIERLLR